MFRTAWLSASMFSAALRPERGLVQVGVRGVPPHRQVRTIELDGGPRRSDGLVLRAHRFGDRLEVLLVVWVVLVGEEQRHDAG